MVLPILAAVLPLIVAAMLLVDPAREARIAGFAHHHGLRVTSAGKAIIAGYLPRTRRWPLAGFLCAYTGLAVWMLTTRASGFAVVPAMAGWLVGAVIAEIQYRPRIRLRETRSLAGEAVPHWLLRVPPLTAAAALITTCLAVAAHAGESSAGLVAWSAGGVAVAATVAAIGWRLTRGPAVTEIDEIALVDRATRRHSLAMMTAVGVVLVGFCMTQQVSIAAPGLFGQTAAAAAGVGWLWAAGALAIAYLIWGAARPAATRQPAIATMRGPRLLAASCAALAVSSLSWLGFSLWRDQPPLRPEAVATTIALTDNDSSESDADDPGTSRSAGPLRCR